MIKESFQLKEEYFSLSLGIIDELKSKSILKKDKFIIGVCGESASGKSITAKCLQIELEKLNINSVILHQDNYYKYTPKENHKKRKADLKWVGFNEVNLNQMQVHVDQFLADQSGITLPVVDYVNNQFLDNKVSFQSVQVLIVEGVYSFLLSGFDYKIFMARTYLETQAKRQARTREVYDPFIEQVLKIENQLIQPLKEKADLIISKDYTISIT